MLKESVCQLFQFGMELELFPVPYQPDGVVGHQALQPAVGGGNAVQDMTIRAACAGRQVNL